MKVSDCCFFRGSSPSLWSPGFSTPCTSSETHSNDSWRKIVIEQICHLLNCWCNFSLHYTCAIIIMQSSYIFSCKNHMIVDVPESCGQVFFHNDNRCSQNSNQQLAWLLLRKCDSFLKIVCHWHLLSTMSSVHIFILLHFPYWGQKTDLSSTFKHCLHFLR